MTLQDVEINVTHRDPRVQRSQKSRLDLHASKETEAAMSKQSIPVIETAKRLGVTKQAVYNLIRRGRLVPSHSAPIPGRYERYPAWYIPIEQIEAFEADRRKIMERRKANRQSRDQGGDE